MEIDLYSDSDIIGYEEKTVLPDGKIRREKPFYKLPTPELYVIYTGDKDVPDELDISDLYNPKPDGTKPLSLKVKIIKSGKKNDCINQYIKFCKAANYMRATYPNDLKRAVQELVEYCIQNNILSDFVKEHRDEVYDMMDVLFNQDYVTQVHENNLVWQGYNQAMEEIRQANENAKQANEKAKQADEKAKQANEKLKKAEEKEIRNIRIIMEKMNFSADEAMDFLETEPDKRALYKADLSEH